MLVCDRERFSPPNRIKNKSKTKQLKKQVGHNVQTSHILKKMTARSEDGA